MLKLMEGMQVLQEKMISGPHRGADYMETVKAPMDLPKLSMWDPESGPIDFNDWLALIQPYMEDLADTATEWWTEMLKQVTGIAVFEEVDSSGVSSFGDADVVYSGADQG